MSFYHFIVENKVIILCVLNIIQCLLVILMGLISGKIHKPVKVVDTLKEVIVRVLPALINQAEAIYFNFSSDPNVKFGGPDKLEYVIKKLAEVLTDLGYGDDIISQYLPFAREQVELILSTPQKKVR